MSYRPTSVVAAWSLALATPRIVRIAPTPEQEGSQALGAAEIHCVERDATNLIISLNNLPTIGVNNLVLVWSAKV